MINLIKRLLPKSVKIILKGIKSFTFDRLYYNWLLWRVPQKHKCLIKKIRKKNTISVVFLVSERSKWKADEVFQLMRNDSLFNPFIIAIPFHKRDLESQKKNVEDIKNYFFNKGYDVYSHFQDANEINKRLKSADLVFFSEPYDVSKNKFYYLDLFTNKLCFYIPYFFMATTHVKGNTLNFNGIYYRFLLSMWRIYWPHNEIKNELEKFDNRVIGTSVVTGYPSMEYIYKFSKKLVASNNAWNSAAQGKIKIIYAPHHSIFLNDPARETLSTFLKNAEIIKELSIKYKDKVSWSFKPHPLLIHHLSEHSDWGKNKAERYYRFWQEQEYTQFDDGIYDDLFLESDAIIHDCSSFIVEYAFTKKPCMYLVGDTDIDNYLNEFGKGVIDVYQKGKSVEEIEGFIKRLIDGKRTQNENTNFFQRYLDDFYQHELPSKKIINDLKQSLGYRNDN